MAGSMPRTQPLPETEKQICARLTRARQATGLTRAGLAKRIGLNQFSLANIERGSAPLKFSVGYQCCAALQLSLAWLATGSPPIFLFSEIAPSRLEKLDKQALFSSVFTGELASAVHSRHKELAAREGVAVKELGQHAVIFDGRLLGATTGENHIEKVKRLIDQAAAARKDDKERLALAQAIERFVFGLDPFGLRSENLILPEAATDTHAVAANTLLPSLLERLKSITAGKGKKSELAAFLKPRVPLSSVSRWLSGEREPGGEVLLQLLHWVALQERTMSNPAESTASGGAGESS